MNLEQIIKTMGHSEAKSIAVAAAEDDVVLEAVDKAHTMGFANPVLFGNKSKIEEIASSLKIDAGKYEIVDCPDPISACKSAVASVRAGKCQALMKGLVQTADILRTVLNKENGLRGPGILSHIAIVNSPVLKRTILITDAAMVPYPDLKTKVELIKNSVAVASGLKMKNPKIAVLAAVEVVNPDMPATLDAAMLTMMNKRGQIKGCIVDGPLALDLALSEEAVKHKKVESEVAGKADILLFHNIEAANSTYKTFSIAGNSLIGGVVMGATCPIILTSRADTMEAKLYSIACATSIVCS